MCVLCHPSVFQPHQQEALTPVATRGNRWGTGGKLTPRLSTGPFMSRYVHMDSPLAEFIYNLYSLVLKFCIGQGAGPSRANDIKEHYRVGWPPKGCWGHSGPCCCPAQGPQQLHSWGTEPLYFFYSLRCFLICFLPLDFKIFIGICYLHTMDLGHFHTYTWCILVTFALLSFSVSPHPHSHCWSSYSQLVSLLLSCLFLWSGSIYFTKFA